MTYKDEFKKEPHDEGKTPAEEKKTVKTEADKREEWWESACYPDAPHVSDR